MTEQVRHTSPATPTAVSEGPRDPITVLFTHFGEDWIRGSEVVLLDLLKNLNPDKVAPFVWCNGKALEEALRARNITTYRTDFQYFGLEYSPRFHPGKYLQQVKEGLRIVKRHEIKILHSNSAAPTQWLWPVSRIARVPLLSHLHINYQMRSRYVLGLHQATVVVGVSRDVSRDFLSDGMSPYKVKVIYNGIDAARLKPKAAQIFRAQLGAPPDALIIGTVGSLIHRKGHDILLRAFRLVCSQTDNVHLVIASDGDQRPKLEELACSLGVANKVTILCYNYDVSSLYRGGFDVLALASRADAFGLVIAEAGLFGIPAVATSIGGIPEVIEDGVTGLLAPPEDPHAFSGLLMRLIGDRNLRRAMGAAARERAERLFTVQIMARQFEETYQELLAVSPDTLGWSGAMREWRVFPRLLARKLPWMVRE